MTDHPYPSGWLEKLPRYGYDASLCPKCGEKSTVIKTGRTAGDQLVRYRICTDCGWKFKTVELYCGSETVALQYRRKEKTT